MAVLAVGVGMGGRKKGCYCPAKSKEGVCCKKDASGAFCPGKCVCKVTTYGHRRAHQCRKENYGLEGAPVVILTISASIAGISFVMALVCWALTCVWSDETHPKIMVQLPRPTFQQRPQKYSSAAHVVEDRTVSL